jgi:hypothetical protein
MILLHKRKSELNSLKKVLLFVFIVAFCLWLDDVFRDKHPQLRADEQRQALHGIVKHIYMNRAHVVSIIQFNGKEFEINGASKFLYDNATVGDTIVKQANSNNCFIIRGDTIRCECYYSGS